jgi:hypothetical protein
MGILSVALGAWVAGYIALHPTADPVTFGIEGLSAAGLVAFGGYLLYRRVARGRAA